MRSALLIILLPAPLAAPHAADAPLSFNDPKPQRYELTAADGPIDWRAIATIRDGKSHVVPSMWQNLPKLDPKSTVTILDVDGPGVVSLIHASALNSGKELYGPEAQGVIVRIFYDGRPTPSISMPFMDFLGDIQCGSAYFNTVYFSKVRESHNFRLPMPFRKHIRIELENPSDKHLRGYVDVQWEEVSNLPEGCGYLRTDYRAGAIDARKPMLLFEGGEPGRCLPPAQQDASCGPLGASTGYRGRQPGTGCALPWHRTWDVLGHLGTGCDGLRQVATT